MSELLFHMFNFDHRFETLKRYVSKKNVPKNELKYFKLINAFMVSMVYGLQFVY